MENYNQNSNTTNENDNTIYIVSVSLILGILTCLTIIGNVFVIAAIIMERNLRTTANYLVLSLAVADLMVACFVMPLGAVTEIRQQWTLGTLLCDIWTSADVLCCTASILHLLAIALDRYWAVTYVDYIHKRTPQRICLMIFTVWTVAAIVSIAPLFGWKDPDFNVRVEQEKRCLISQDIGYQVFATISTFYGPLIFILLLYWKIYQVARKRIRHKPGKTIAPASTYINPKMIVHIENEVATKKFSFKNKIFSTKKPSTTIKQYASRSDNDNETKNSNILSENISSENFEDKDDGDTNNNNFNKISTSSYSNEVKQQQQQQQTDAQHNCESNNNNNANNANSVEKCLVDLNASKLMNQSVQHIHNLHHQPHNNITNNKNKTSSLSFPSTTSSSSSSSSSENTMIMDKTYNKVPKKYFTSMVPSKTIKIACKSDNDYLANDITLSPATIATTQTTNNDLKTSSHQIATNSQHLNQIQMRNAIKESIELKRERKAAKILAIITGIFVMCWLPFFVMALLMPLCKNCQPSKYIFSIFLWLGYCNSLLNPIIYTIFSPDFRNGFRRILCGKKRR